MSATAPRALVLTGPRQLAHAPVEPRPLGPTEVRLRAVRSAISHGTELALYRGTAPFAERSFDPALRVFLPEPDAAAYPMPLGYELVGEVVDVGSGLDDVAVGALVHAAVPHAESAVVDLDAPGELGYPAQVLPPGMDPEPALFQSLACVALFAVHDARLQMGDAVVVSGLGVVGLLALQLARASGALAVVGVDPAPARRAAALRLGADVVLDPGAGPVGRAVKARLPGAGLQAGADAVIETSGVDRALHEAVAAVKVGGTVVSAGFAQGGAPQLRLGEEWHHNRPQLVSSMGVWGCPHRDAPRWDRLRVAATALGLLASGALRTDGLVTATTPFDRAAEAYRTLDADPTAHLKVALAYAAG